MLPSPSFLIGRVLFGLAPVFAPLSPSAAQALELIALPGATYRQGDPAGEPNESPRAVTVGPFRIMVREATNAEFAAFVAVT